jgi:endonuclease/exonuclease/phosphatase family metal-dependent hydrolase
MSRQIRIMTYNIHSCIGMDGKASTQRIAEVIFRSGVDIVALQEVDTGLARTGLVDQAREITGILNMHYHFHPSLFLEEGAYGNAILSLFPLRLVRGGPLPTPSGPRQLEKRGVLWVEAAFPTGTVQVITTHFGLVRQERRLQVTSLLGAEWLGSPKCRPPVIVCGDFNALPFSQVYRRFAGRFHDIQRSLAGWRPKNTWPTRYPLMRIDHMFITPDITVEGITVPLDTLSRMASDHLPLIATVRLSESGYKEPGQ